jgi:hypothetical protein
MCSIGDRVHERFEQGCSGESDNTDGRVSQAAHAGHVKTAETIVKHHPGIALHKQTALRERVCVSPFGSSYMCYSWAQNMGELQGRRVGTQLGRIAAGLEPRQDLMSRATSWWQEFVNPSVANASDDAGAREDILVVSHGGFIHALTQVMLEGNHDLAVAAAEGVAVGGKCFNTSITVVEVDRTSLRGLIVKYSDISHLTEPVVQDNADVVEQ